MKKFLSGQTVAITLTELRSEPTEIESALLSEMLSKTSLSLKTLWDKSKKLEGLAKVEFPALSLRDVGVALELATSQVLSRYFLDVTPHYLACFNFESGQSEDEGSEDSSSSQEASVRVEFVKAQFGEKFESHFKTHQAAAYAEMRSFVEAQFRPQFT